MARVSTPSEGRPAGWERSNSIILYPSKYIPDSRLSALRGSPSPPQVPIRKGGRWVPWSAMRPNQPPVPPSGRVCRGPRTASASFALRRAASRGGSRPRPPAEFGRLEAGVFPRIGCVVSQSASPLARAAARAASCCGVPRRAPTHSARASHRPARPNSRGGAGASFPYLARSSQSPAQLAPEGFGCSRSWATRARASQPPACIFTSFGAPQRRRPS